MTKITEVLCIYLEGLGKVCPHGLEDVVALVRGDVPRVGCGSADLLRSGLET